MLQKIYLPVAIVAMLLPRPAVAENASENLAEKDVEEVVVTGTRSEKRLAESPVLTTVVGEREIRRSGSVSTLETIQDNTPGVVVSPNAMGNNMRIRGLNSRYILMLVDGERLVSEGAGGNVNLDQIDIGNIRRIEMIGGAASALYGSNAVGAVINFITKEPAHPLEVGANILTSSHNTWRARVDAGSALKRFTARAGVFRNSSDGFGANGSGAYAARYADQGANLKLGYLPSKRSDIRLTGRYFRHETFNRAASMSVKHPMTHNLTAGLSGGVVSRDSSNNLRVSVNADKYFDYDILERLGDQRSLRNTASYLSARAIDTYASGEKWELVGGAEWNHEENYATSTLGATPTTKRVDDLNGFAQALYKPVTALDLVAGARYTRHSRFGSALTPKLSAMYSLGGLRLRAGVGTAFRAPSIKELYYDFDHQGMFWVYGNPDLKPERGLYSSLSGEYGRGGFNGSISLYHNRINNKITQYDVINSGGGNEKYYKNVGSATLRGIDLCLSYNLLKELTLRGSYGLCDAVDNSTGLQLESNVRHSATLAATWNGRIVRSPFSLQLAGRLNSPILYQSVDSSGQISRTESKSYSIWKLTLVKPFVIGDHRLELTAKVDNIFNFREASFIDPGRQFLFGIRYDFKLKNQ